MIYVKVAVVAAALAVLAACGQNGDEAFVEATPDANGLALEITGGAAEGVDEAALVGDAQKQGLGGTEIEYLKHARDAVRYLNGQVKQVLTPLVELVNSGPAQQASTGAVRVYGPKDRGNVTWRLKIRKLAAERFAWKLEGKPLGGQDSEYVRVMAGRMMKGTQPHRGHGVMGVDLDALVGIDSAFPGQGKLLVGFGQSAQGKTLVYVLRGFTPDAAQWDPVTATFVGHRLLPSKLTRVRLASSYNLKDSPTSAKELVRSRIRFIPGVGGRADILATGGDLPQGKVYAGSACWDATESEGFFILRECVQDQPESCTVIATRGDRANCQPDLTNVELPDLDENDASAEAGSPVDDVVAPPGMPSGEE